MAKSILTFTGVKNLSDSPVFFFKFTPGEKMIEASKGLITGKYALFIWDTKFDAACMAKVSRRHFMSSRAYEHNRLTDEAISFLRTIQHNLASVIWQIKLDMGDNLKGSFVINSISSYEEIKDDFRAVGFSQEERDGEPLPF